MVLSDQQFRKLAPAARKCMRLGTAIWVAVMLAIALVLWLVLRYYQIPLPLWTQALLLAWAALWLLYLLVAPAIRYRRYRYVIDQEQIVVRQGLWFITKQFAPIERIHQIAVKSGPIDRLYGLAKVIATTAGGTVTVSFLEEKIAQEIAAMLQRQVRDLLAQQGISLANLPAAAAETEAADHD